jgi:hypothetical protein
LGSFCMLSSWFVVGGSWIVLGDGHSVYGFELAGWAVCLGERRFAEFDGEQRTRILHLVSGIS